MRTQNKSIISKMNYIIGGAFDKTIGVTHYKELLNFDI